MNEIKWVKLTVDMFDNRKIRYIRKLPEGNNIVLIWVMLAQNRAFVDSLLDDVDKEKVTKMRTAMLTRYAENKEVRGIMKLVNRQTDAHNGYKLTYEAELVSGRTEKQTLAEWLGREQKWQEKRTQLAMK